MFAEPFLVEAIPGKRRPPSLSRMKIVYLRNLVAFSRSRLTIKVRVTQIYIYISDGIPEGISFESVDDSMRSSDLEIL